MSPPWYQRLRRSLAACAACATCAIFAVALATAILAMPEQPAEALPARVAAVLDDPATGVAATHPITAVLLDLRAYDTLLEVAVLLVAVVVALALREAQPDSPDRMGLDNPLLRAVIGWLLPLMLMVAAYLLWAGATRPGGAFQAGAVLAAAGVLLRLAGITVMPLRTPSSGPGGPVAGDGGQWPVPRPQLTLVIGLAAFTLVGCATLLAGRGFLNYPPALAGALVFAIELALTLSIALALLCLFQLAPPQSDVQPQPERRRRPRR
ncbi:MAG: MnhB domain-containing protein [Rhodocyclaceae bacterium]